MTTTDRIPYPTKFPLGQIVATQGALAACDPHHLQACLYRHSRGDWGNVCGDDKATNDQALIDGDRVLSAYPIDPTKPSKGYVRGQRFHMSF